MKDKFVITSRDINKLPDGKHRIERGLYLKVRYDGKQRQYLFRYAGREKVIGSAFDISFADAKRIAAKLRLDIAEGNVSEAMAPREIVEPEREPTFAEIAKAAIDATEKARRWKNEKHASQWRNTIATYAIPVIGKKKISSIGRADILKILGPIWEEKTDTASRLQGRLERIFEYATFVGVYDKPNPARWKGNLDMLLAPPSKVKPVRHHEAMTMDEARKFAALTMETGYWSYVAILFGMLTACRVQEFLYTTWDEIDLEQGVFSVPPSRRKDGRAYPHRVPLSRQAIELLSGLERNGDLVFRGRYGGRMSIDTCRVTLQRVIGRGVTMHGCRSTFRDWCAENGIDRVLAEKSLMHTTGSEVEEAYQRSDLLEQRREVMQRWADALFLKTEGPDL